MKIAIPSWILLSAWLVFPGDTPSPLADIGPAPEVRLTDSEGKPFDLAKLHGKAVIVSFIFTSCNGTCPLTTAALAKVRDRLETEGLWGKDVEFVSISLDPANDTPGALKLYASIYHARPETWHFLTGPVEEVDRVVKSWGMWARRTELGVLDHPSRIFLVDPRGHEREIYNLETLSAEVVLADIRGVLSETSAGGAIKATDAEKAAFLKLLAGLPQHGEFFADEGVARAEPYTRVLLSLGEKDLKDSDVDRVCVLSVDLMDRKEQREFGVKHFREIAHPTIKLFWGVVLFNKQATSPEIVGFLRSALDSPGDSKTLSEMVGPNYEDFVKRVRAYPEKP